MGTTLSENREVQKAINEEWILYTSVTRAIPASDTEQAYAPLTVPLATIEGKSLKGIMYADEADSETDHQGLTYLVGLRIPFVIKEVDDEREVLICSRKIAQEKIKASMMNSLVNGEQFEGQIIGFTPFGAFVEVNGIVGLLRNADYSDDHSRINERYQTSDHIIVKCKSIGNDERHRISWEAATKYHRTTPFVCDLEPGAIVLGRIIDIKNFKSGPAVFVRLEDNHELDVMCGMPPEMEIEKGVAVTLRVTSVEHENEFARPKIRGRILRLA